MLTGSLSKQSEKTAAARAKRRKRRKKGDAQTELHVEWSAEFRSLYGKGTEVPPWGPAERSLARKLIAEIGFDKALEMTRHFVSTWKSRTFDGVPGVRLMWTIRQRLLAEMTGAVGVNAKREKLMSDEWDETSAGPSDGWG